MGNLEAQALKPANVGEAEWRLRQELAACYHVFDFLRWTESIFNHITVRVPGPERHFLINPFGLNYGEVTASNLVKVDLEGNVVGRSDHGVNRAGFIIHAALHAAREDAHCIMHTHTTTGVAIACKKAGLKHDDFYGAMLVDKVAYHDFEGITVRADEQPRLVRSLGDKSILILRNHGLLVAERDIAHAFSLLWTLQRACDVQCQAAAIAGPDIELPDEIRRRSASDSMRVEDAEGATCQKMFDAAVRKMEAARRGGHVDFRS